MSTSEDEQTRAARLIVELSWRDGGSTPELGRLLRLIWFKNWEQKSASCKNAKSESSAVGAVLQPSVFHFSGSRGSDIQSCQDGGHDWGYQDRDFEQHPVELLLSHVWVSKVQAQGCWTTWRTSSVSQTGRRQWVSPESRPATGNRLQDQPELLSLTCLPRPSTWARVLPMSTRCTPPHTLSL